MHAAPGPGDPAPDFRLPDTLGRGVDLAELKGPGHLVLFFVPHPARGVCARTQCGLRDHHDELEALSTNVVGVSPVSRDTLERVAAEQVLPFVMLSDRDRSVHRAYGVSSTWLRPGRATFVLDREGVIAWVERHPLSAPRHSEGALRAVRRLVAEDESRRRWES